MMWTLFAQQTANGLAYGMGLALIALGLTLVFGVLHIINFAHGELYMIGGFAAVLGMTAFSLPYPVAIAMAVVVAGLAAWIVDVIAVRPVLKQKEGHSLVLVTTFAASILIHEAVLVGYGPSPVRIDGFQGISEIGSTVVTAQRWFVIIAGIAVLILTEVALRRTTIGRNIRAIANSAFAAQVVGINVAKIRTVTFVAAGALAGFTGAAMVPITMFNPTIGHNIIVDAFVVVVVGGMGNALGAVICGIGVGLLQAWLAIVMPEQMGVAAVYGLLLVTLLVRPTGLLGGGRI